jgi:hypothetical protein
MSQLIYKSAIIKKRVTRDGYGNSFTSYYAFLDGAPSFKFDKLKEAKAWVDTHAGA